MIIPTANYQLQKSLKLFHVLHFRGGMQTHTENKMKTIMHKITFNFTLLVLSSAEQFSICTYNDDKFKYLFPIGTISSLYVWNCKYNLPSVQCHYANIPEHEVRNLLILCPTLNEAPPFKLTSKEHALISLNCTRSHIPFSNLHVN